MNNMPIDTSNSRTALFLYFGFKTATAAVSALAIYFGYSLFVLGVTGKASLSIESQTLKGQLINAAPGLFFAVGGVVALIVIVWKGVEITFNDGGLFSAMNKRGVQITRQELKRMRNKQKVAKSESGQYRAASCSACVS